MSIFPDFPKKDRQISSNSRGAEEDSDSHFNSTGIKPSRLLRVITGTHGLDGVADKKKGTTYEERKRLLV